MTNSTTTPCNIKTNFYRIKIVKSIWARELGKETIINAYNCELEPGKQYFCLSSDRKGLAARVATGSPYRLPIDKDLNFPEEIFTDVQLENTLGDQRAPGAVDVIEVIRLERSFDLMSNKSYNKENRKNHFVADTYDESIKGIHSKLWTLSGKQIPTSSFVINRDGVVYKF